VWCACLSCPHGPTVWLSTSPPGTCSAVLLFFLGSCRCGRHAHTLGLVDDRQQSLFHMHGEIHRWSLVSTKHSQNVRTRGGYLINYGCYNGRLRGAQGALSAQRALRGALCTSAPKIGAHSTSLHRTEPNRLDSAVVTNRGGVTNDFLPCGNARPTCGASAGHQNPHTLTWVCGGSCGLQFVSRPSAY